jgi:hypothetical protein
VIAVLKISKNGAGNDRKSIPLIRGTGIARSLKGHGFDGENFSFPKRAAAALGPAAAAMVA